jgi:hypothetical protein
MPIQRRNAPTYESVSFKIRTYEQDYQMTTEEFLIECPERVDEDDAMEWRFLAEQRRVLVSAFIGYSAPRVKESRNLENYPNPELLAA